MAEEAKKHGFSNKVITIIQMLTRYGLDMKHGYINMALTMMHGSIRMATEMMDWFVRKATTMMD